MSRQPPSHRSDYLREIPLGTRWDDNDIYGHMNNTVHYRLFDTAVNGFLIAECGFCPRSSDIIGIVAESGCRYFAELHFPGTVIAGLRVGHLGRTSVRYEIALFADDALQAAAEGFFVHVFVDRFDRRPRSLPESLRASLAKLTRGGPAKRAQTN